MNNKRKRMVRITCSENEKGKIETIYSKELCVVSKSEKGIAWEWVNYPMFKYHSIKWQR